MSTIVTNCPQCNAPARGPLCEYCGTQVQLDLDFEGQKHALETFHRLLANSEEPKQINLLVNGFLPDDRQVLIDSGLRCIPLIQDRGARRLTAAAAGRLKAVTLKLRLLPAGDEDATRAVKEFEARLRQYDSKQVRDVLIGLAILITGLLIVGGLIWGIISMLR